MTNKQGIKHMPNNNSGRKLPPVASFTQDKNTIQAPDTVAFTDTSTGGVDSWLWDFGDGNTSTLQNPTHTYAAGNGYMQVSLTVTNNKGSDEVINSVLLWVPHEGSGGTVTEFDLGGITYRRHTFTEDGVFSVLALGTFHTEMYVEVVAGGGGSGRSQYASGGGGGGGFNGGNALPFVVDDYAVTVGQGGAGRVGSDGNGDSGANSSLIGPGVSLTAIGGGGGGGGSNAGSSIGSTGGGGASKATAGAVAGGVGGAGGNGGTGYGSTTAANRAAGGGAQNGPGGNATSGTGGNGRVGIGVTGTYYGGGGGGGANSGGVSAGTGGLGGGGAGSKTGSGSPGTDGLGGGAGGSCENADGANGGKGTVVISYAIEKPA